MGSYTLKYMNKKPKIFTYTAYRLPKEELLEINNCDLMFEEIVNGFHYTIVGRGVLDNKSKLSIIEAINMLISKFPNNKEYQKALINAKELKGPFVTESSKNMIKRLIRESLT